MTAPKTRIAANQAATDDQAAAAPEQSAPTGQRPFADILADNPQWAYLFDGRLPVRPATDDELAEYARRADDPHWADIYHPNAEWEKAVATPDDSGSTPDQSGDTPDNSGATPDLAPAGVES